MLRPLAPHYARRVPTTRLMLTAGAISVAGFVAACGGNNDPTDGSPATKGGAAASGVSSNPPVDSARAAVSRLRRWVNTGAPTVVTAYDPKTLQFLGTETLLRVLSPLKSSILSGERLSEEKTQLGTLVTVETRQRGAPPTYTGYLLTKKGDQWLVGYDGLLASQIVATVQASRQAKIDPKAKDPSPEAVASGQAAMVRYVTLFAPPPRRGQLRIK